jgi:hypothetical protein
VFPHRKHLAREKFTEEIFHGNEEESREEEKETLTVARGRYLAWALSEFQEASREKHLLRGFFIGSSSGVGRSSLAASKGGAGILCCVCGGDALHRYDVSG